jgi:hypothetical protein
MGLTALFLALGGRLDMLRGRETRPSCVDPSGRIFMGIEARALVSSLRAHDAVVLAAVKDASRRGAAPFGRP